LLPKVILYLQKSVFITEQTSVSTSVYNACA